jgi:hypothetical protein
VIDPADADLINDPQPGCAAQPRTVVTSKRIAMSAADGMDDRGRRFKIGLLALGAFHLVFFLAVKSRDIIGIRGVLYPDGTPVGGDFINLWSTARLIVLERVSEIYRVARFMAFQDTITGGVDIGLREWAYPPQSLLLAWPFGLTGYYAAFAVWTVVGLLILYFGARRFGFDRLETAIILTSPATILNIYFGQTGSFAAGLLLVALSARTARDPKSIAAAAILTVKPQAGFLIPVVWALQRRWQAIAWTALAVAVLVGLALAVFGLQPWRDYVGITLPVLSALEREGTGPFMTMIPSTFMALRIVTGNSDFALIVHGIVAAAVAIVLVARLWRVNDGTRQTAMMLIATVLMTPYMHNYDLALLLCGALLVGRRWYATEMGPFRVKFLVIVAWALPHLVVGLNRSDVPVSPLLILPLLFLA